MDQKGITKLEIPFYGALGFSIAAFLCSFLAFSTPYWMEAYPGAESNLQRLGIWTVCFDRYMQPMDQKATVWNGCYWIFDRVFLAKGLWEWLNPRWLTAIQVLITAAFIGQCAQMICMILYFLYYGHPLAESAAACFFHAGSAFFTVISLIIFGIGYQDRNWNPRPDFCHLSWSYGFAILSAIFSIMACFYLYCVARNDKEMQEEYIKYEDYQIQMGEDYYGGGPGMFSGAPSASIYSGTAPSRSVLSVPLPASKGGGKQTFGPNVQYGTRSVA
jgi:hypothetical protein